MAIKLINMLLARLSESQKKNLIGKILSEITIESVEVHGHACHGVRISDKILVLYCK